MIHYVIHDWNQHGEEVAYDVTATAPTGEQIRAVVTLALVDDRIVPKHEDPERWLPPGWLPFLWLHSEAPSLEIEDGLLDALRAVDVDVLECDGTCGRCAGSGEGYVDGSRCSACGGSGVPRDRDEDDRREAALEDLADARRDDRMTEDDHE